jgi:hypothetical protein
MLSEQSAQRIGYNAAMKQQNQFSLHTLFSVITLCGLLAAILSGTSPFAILLFLFFVWSFDLLETRFRPSRNRLD